MFLTYDECSLKLYMISTRKISLIVSSFKIANLPFSVILSLPKNLPGTTTTWIILLKNTYGPSEGSKQQRVSFF